jgi:hypothetical protein
LEEPRRGRYVNRQHVRLRVLLQPPLDVALDRTVTPGLIADPVVVNKCARGISGPLDADTRDYRVLVHAQHAINVPLQFFIQITFAVEFRASQIRHQTQHHVQHLYHHVTPPTATPCSVHFEGMPPANKQNFITTRRNRNGKRTLRQSRAAAVLAALDESTLSTR